MSRPALHRRLEAISGLLASRRPPRPPLDLSALSDAELRAFEVGMLRHFTDLSEDEAWCAVTDTCCYRHPYDPTDPGCAEAARAGIKRRLDFLCRWLPTSHHGVPAALADRLRDLGVWRRTIERTFQLDPHGPSYEGRVAQALLALAAEEA